jgi:DNA replication protein DnaC
MANKNLETLLVEYEEKRRRADMELDSRKQEIYKKFPRLEEIEDELNKISINKAKAILSKQQNIDSLEQKALSLKNEKELILKNENIDLSKKYECEVCKDTGYIQKENCKTVMCNCLKQKLLNLSYNKSNLSDIKKDNFANFNSELFSDKGNNSPRKNILAIKKACMDFIENFDNLDTKNLLFLGNTGLGKTFMSNCIANELLKNGKTVLYQTAPVLLETIIDKKFNKYKTQNADEFYNNVLTVDLLIIDDLGAESLNSMKLSELFTVLNTRILNLNNKPTKTIISTNLNIEQIFRIYEERIGSRIAGYYNIYQFFGEDLRLKK